MVKSAQFMMWMTVPNSKLEVSLHSTNWIKFCFSTWIAMALKMGMDVHMVSFKFLVARVVVRRMNGVCNQTAYFIISSIVIIKSFFPKCDIYL